VTSRVEGAAGALGAAEGERASDGLASHGAGVLLRSRPARRGALAVLPRVTAVLLAANLRAGLLSTVLS
jgi:hypothetical protein